MSFRGRSQWLHTWFHLKAEEMPKSSGTSRTTEHTEGEGTFLAAPPRSAPEGAPDLFAAPVGMEKAGHHARDLCAGNPLEPSANQPSLTAALPRSSGLLEALRSTLPFVPHPITQ